MHTRPHRIVRRGLSWLAALFLVSLASAAFAQAEADPPGRVAYVSARQGSVVFAPEGEEDWVDLPQNRPLTAGDRIWSDRGARAELQLGSATVHVDAESHLGVRDLDDRVAQFILQQGTVNARVREVAQGENFEIGTPNIAFRALQPGDYRIDVDAQSGTTRVTVASGLAAVFGQRGETIQLAAGQTAAFTGRSLAQVQVPPFRQDDFGAWAAERNRLEDQSIAARYVPRGVVGYAQLDQYGTWSQEPEYGAVWYPQVAVQDWAPYRYGHWTWVAPWGWTWVDDAPWGFAPFHYGRWTMIGSRWAWVPGRMAARPVYSPALVVFIGGGGSQLGYGSGPAVGWYPLAPGEAWWPWYRTSPRYVNFANFNINLGSYPRHYHEHVWRHRPFAITSMRDDDFRRGRPVHRNWRPVEPRFLGNTQPGVVPQRPEHRRPREAQVPRLQATPPAAQSGMPAGFFGSEFSPAAIEQQRAAREQERLQRDADRAARQQIRQAEEQRRQAGGGQRQQETIQRQQQDAVRRQQELNIQREAWTQGAQQEQARQQQREQALRQQQERAAQRETLQQRQEQLDAQRRAWIQGMERPAEQPRAAVPQQQVVPAQVQPPQVQSQPAARERGEARRAERAEQRGEGRGEMRLQRDEDGRIRGPAFQR